MKFLFLWLLGKFANSEKERVAIFRVLFEKVCDDYNEQTFYGNVYNQFIEFMLGNDFIIREIASNDTKSVDVIKRNINSAFDDGVQAIKSEILL